MRQLRLKADEDCEAGYYHCISRFAHQAFLFQDAQKEPSDRRLVELVRRAKCSYGADTLKQELRELRKAGTPEAARDRDRPGQLPVVRVCGGDPGQGAGEGRHQGGV